MPSKTDPGNFFEDFKIGHVYTCPIPRTITLGDMAQYIALTGDRTPRFCDARNEVHPLLVFHLVLGQTVRQISLNARANLGYAGLLWLRPVYAGDTIHTQAQVIGLKENANKETGIVYVKTQAFNQEKKTVMEYIRWVMVKKKDSVKATDYLAQPSVPKLVEVLGIDHLTPVTDAVPNKEKSGGAFYFNDYQVGERIAHVDGMTVNSSDHMTFTRMFQNTAKIHFDALLTDGKPLVFGGFPMSLGYAQSFNGLENRTGICSINGGSHANPVYAGDTLYTFTEVLNKLPFSSESKVGALRLRMIVVKNEPVKNIEKFSIQIDDPKKPGKKKYHPNVVLDLDYWEQMATGA
jgi:2-methylfumaryl-CoA hydratase